MADNIKKPARARMWKRIALYLGSVSTIALVAFVIISFLPFGNDAFSIRIDDPGTANSDKNHFRMGRGYATEEFRNEDKVYLKGKSADKMVPTYAKNVEDYLASLGDKNEGQNNFEHRVYKTNENSQASENNGSGNSDNYEVDKSFALVYTVYLTNESKDEPQSLKYRVDVDSYYTTVEGRDILDYFRILVQTEVMEKGEMTTVYYGRKHNHADAQIEKNGVDETVSFKNDEGDYREPISTFVRNGDAGVVVADFESRWGTEENKLRYCTNFSELSNENKSIIEPVSIEIPPSSTMRFTFASYFEGADVDCGGSIPKNSYLLLSLHFGV